MDKQIEEIKQLARDIFEPKTAIDGIDLAFAAVHGADRDDTHFMRIATHLYGKGYRKAFDVAREVFAEIERIAMSKIDGDLSIAVLNDTYYIEAIDEIKKKYESEGGE